MSRERLVFLVAVGLIAFHVVDDSFIQPEDGTSAGDHVVSGLVPLAALAAGAAVYPRLRAGWRAALALFFGMFGVVAGLEGWHYAREVGASGDDYSGLAALPAGLVLLALGAVTLWRSRRREGPRARRYLRRALIGAAGVILTVSVVAPFMAGYAYTHLARAVVPDPELGGADYEDVTFETSDGLELEGWYIPSKNRAAVIAFPGRSGPREPARLLARHGYGVLLFDRRGEGASEGDPNAFGWNGTKDVDAAVAFLRNRPDVDPERIGGIGLSVGGEMLLESAAGGDALRAVVSEGAGIRSVREATELDGAEMWGQLPTWAATTLGTAVFSGRAPPDNLKELAPRIAPRPVFFIYADRGQGGEELSAEFYEAAGEPKELWKTDSGHTGGYDAAPEEYERRVVGFFDDALR
ncbi:MAG: dienelactone hydrolase family protein [Thermoleophilaceae bacterium]|nr:dienelactone hydrolase family protein [Thermoleophilaceae bacterium]